MRVIRGSLKGKTIHPPKGFNARPTTDFAKESLFNILENIFTIEDISVLDLFSGSGNISLEFLSRGCERVTSVEISKKYSIHIKNLIESLFPGKSNVRSTDAIKFCKNGSLDYDLIFADPPYSDENVRNIPDLVFNNTSLKDDAMFILEHSIEHDFKDHKCFVEHRKYGNVHFSFFKKK